MDVTIVESVMTPHAEGAMTRRLFLMFLIGVTVAGCAPPAGSPAFAVHRKISARRFVVIGDWGTGLESSDRVAARMCKWRKKHHYDLVLTAGDNIYPDGAASNFENNFFEPFSCLLEKGVQWRSALGNHDVVTDNGQPELDEPAFGMRGRNYVVRTSGVRFVIANSNDIRRKWLRRKLGAEDGDLWIVVSFHHPVFSPGEHGSTPGFADWMPKLFARKDVDLVVNGHDHLYAVTKPVRGVRYAVTGGGGASLYDCTDSEPKAVVCKSRHHFLSVRVTAEAMAVRAVTPAGKVLDRFRVEAD
jgi:Calcineurin-like phosphoesterase